MITKAKPKIIEIFSHLQYRQKIMLIILMFSVISMAVPGYFYFARQWNIKMENVLNSYSAGMDIGVDNLNNLYNSSINKLEYIKTNKSLNAILTRNYDDDTYSLVSDYLNFNEIMGSIMTESLFDPYLYKINIYSFNKSNWSSQHIKYIADSDGFSGLDESIVEEVVRSDELYSTWKIRKVNTNGRDINDYICVYSKITDIDKPIAILEVRISVDMIKNTFDFKLPEESILAYTADNYGSGLIINLNKSNNEAMQVISEYKQGGSTGDFIPVEKMIKTSSHKVIMFISKKLINAEMLKFILPLATGVLAIIFLMFLIAKGVAFSLTKRLNDLILNISVEDDSIAGFKDVGTIYGNDEFSKINTNFIKLVNKIKDYYQKIVQFELDKTKMDLELLQAGINPHFLYNTLSAIKWSTNDPKLSELVDSMVDYYRIMLNKGNSILKIENEIEMIRKYIEIQRFAYGNAFSYKIHIGAQVGQCKILKNIIQPIVENAVLHGINGLECGGYLEITGELKENKILFSIYDNGMGIPPEKLEQVLAGDNTNMYGGYGMKNVIQRIKTYYGNEYGIEITSEPQNGTRVDITIPVIY